MGQVSIVRQNPTDLDECAHDERRNLNRASRVEHTRGHDRPVLGECVGKGLGESPNVTHQPRARPDLFAERIGRFS